MDLSLSCSLQSWVVWTGGYHSNSRRGPPVNPDDPAPSALRALHSGSQVPQTSSYHPSPIPTPGHRLPPGHPALAPACPGERARHRPEVEGTAAPETGPRSWPSQPAPGAALSWKTFWLFVYIAARRSPATWLSPPAADSGPRPAPSAPRGLRAGEDAPAARPPARRRPHPLTIWWWWWLLGMLVSWKNVLRAVCGQTQRQGGG